MFLWNISRFWLGYMALYPSRLWTLHIPSCHRVLKTGSVFFFRWKGKLGHKGSSRVGFRSLSSHLMKGPEPRFVTSSARERKWVGSHTLSCWLRNERYLACDTLWFGKLLQWEVFRVSAKMIVCTVSSKTSKNECFSNLKYWSRHHTFTSDIYVCE
jgi:hypothetical protein